MGFAMSDGSTVLSINISNPFGKIIHFSVEGEVY